MEARLCEHIHPAVEECLNIHQQGSQSQSRPPRRKRNEQIDIASVVGVSSRHRPKYPYVLHAVTFCKRKNLATMFFD